MGGNIIFMETRPFVRYVQHLNITKSISFFNMAAYDNRVFYAAEGQGVIRVDNAEYAMRPGCLILWRAGQAYDLTSPQGGLRMLGCNFDFTQKNNGHAAPVPPAKRNSFCPADILDRCRISDTAAFNGTVYLENMQPVEELLRQALDEYTRQRLMAAVRLSALLTLVLAEAAGRILLTGSGMGHGDGKVDEILHYIRLHYNEDLSNKRLGEAFNYHPNYINQLVCAHTGMPLHQYLLRYRIQRAIHYLQNTDYSAGRIAEMTGFRDYNYFLKYFKQQTGYTTRRFRPD